MGLFSKISGSSSSSRPRGHGRATKLLFLIGSAGSTLANALKDSVSNETRHNVNVVSEAVEVKLCAIRDSLAAERMKKAASLAPVNILQCDSPDLEHADPLRVEFEILELRDQFNSIPNLIRDRGYLPIKKILSWLGHTTGEGYARFTDEELLSVVEAWCEKQRQHIAKNPAPKKNPFDFIGYPKAEKSGSLPMSASRPKRLHPLIASSTKLAIRRRDEAIDLARKFQDDPDRDKREILGLCPACHYAPKPHLSLKAFHDWSCRLCLKPSATPHADSAVPVFCDRCARKSGLCVRCGGSRDLIEPEPLPSRKRAPRS